MSQNGKGRRPILGYNLSRYQSNFPFPERKISTLWCEQLGVFPMGAMPEGRLTEGEFREALAKVGHMIKTSEPGTNIAT